MQQNETFKVRIPEAQEAVRTPGSVQSPAAEAWIDRIKKDLESVKEKEKTPNEQKMNVEKSVGFAEKFRMSIGDTIRDVVTANKMAADKFEGDSALMQIAKGSMTTVIGVGIERILEDSFKEAIRVNGNGIFLDRPRMQFSPETRKKIEALKIDNASLYDFIYHASKDLATGVVYNGLAFFSRPMLKSAGGEHLMTSLAIDATEALGTRGLKSHFEAEKATNILASAQVTYDSLAGELRNVGDPTLENQKADKFLLVRQKVRAERELRRLQDAGIPKDQTLAWQTLLRKYLNYSNPATILGLDMIAKGGITLIKNLKEVRKVRKEKGGLPGKQVFMPKDEGRRSFGDRKPWTNNREQGNRQPYTKGTVYYGQGRSSVDAKQQEEEDRAKLM